uniref:AMP-binding domain-containing protein n=1 Tax=Caenorhabditis tropicalis TaxID=1561998 RepID=A0A1I7TKB0_9PELO
MRITFQQKTFSILLLVYGTTECGVLLCSTGKGISDGKTVGLPYPMVDLKINEKNEILVKSATGIEEDFMETGDLGCFSYKSKEIMIVGRVKEMMKIRGWQVNPNEIEEVIRKVNTVVDCAVYQISDKLIAKVIGNADSKTEIMETVKSEICL